jgi:hypothetical protein
VYDITSTDSFNRAKAWVRELQRQGSPNMIMALAGEDPATAVFQLGEVHMTMLLMASSGCCAQNSGRRISSSMSAGQCVKQTGDEHC